MKRFVGAKFKRMKLLFLLSLLFVIVHSRCPNSCNGHGLCTVSNICNCFDGWAGGAPDCSLRTCPNGTAWADKAYATDGAHQSLECSNAGICNRDTGQCMCFSGFTGSACQRNACPNDCSGHGVCGTIGDVALFNGAQYDNSVAGGGSGIGIAYTNWDKDSIQICECDDGYFGADCSLVMCPKGDDPLTLNQNYRSIQVDIITSGSDPLSGRIGIVLNGKTVFLNLDAMSNALCANYLSFRGPFGNVGCTYTRNNGYNFRLELVFYSWPTFPNANNLFSHDGNPARTDFYCDVSNTVSYTKCTFTDIEHEDVREYAYCSNRGTCDFATGDCNCNDGFGGPACSNITLLHETGSNSLPGLQVNVNGFDYVSTALQINSEKGKADDFYLIEAMAGEDRVFYVKGDGTVSINRLEAIQSGQTISSGGLYIEDGGCTIVGDGLNVLSSDSDSPAVLISSTHTGGYSSSVGVLKVSSSSTSPNAHNLIEAANQGTTRFALRGDGNLQVRAGGAHITGGFTVSTGGMVVTGGATISSGGLQITKNGLGLTNGLTIYTEGMKIISGGAQIFSGGESIYAGGLKVAGGVSISSGGFYVTAGATIANTGFTVSGGVTIYSGGVVITTKGLTISNDGVVITTKGLTVSNDGVMVTTKGLTIGRDGLVVSSNGLTVANDGMRVTGGITVNSGGTNILAGGLTVTTGGLVVTLGGTIQSNGFVVTGGLTVQNNGIVVTGGLTVKGAAADFDSGLLIYNGLSVRQGGLVVTGGITVGDNDVIINNNARVGIQMTVEGGLVVNNGMTVTGDIWYGNSLTFSDRRLKTNLIPIRGALSKVNKLHGVYFNWIQDEPSGLKFDDKAHVGVIAQDVLEVLPEAVNDKHNGQYLGVDYNAIVSLVIEAIHDLHQIMKINEENNRDLISSSCCQTSASVPTTDNNNKKHEDFSAKEEENKINHHATESTATIESSPVLGHIREQIVQLQLENQELKQVNDEQTKKIDQLEESLRQIKENQISSYIEKATANVNIDRLRYALQQPLLSKISTSHRKFMNFIGARIEKFILNPWRVLLKQYNRM